MKPASESVKPRDATRVVAFLVSSLGLFACAVWLMFVSRWFGYGSPHGERPILGAVAVFSVAFVFQMVSLAAAIRLPDGTRMTTAILLAAVLLRFGFFFTEPIQEVDLYRYIWDGAVVCEGVSPYRDSPQSVVTAGDEDPTREALRALLSERPGLAEVHSRVHFPEVTTVYPPISQIVFAAAHLATPKNASARLHVLVMKAFLLLFDLATLWLILLMLRRFQLHSGWLIVYASSPLVLKEFANSGHLDSIAVFCTVAAVDALCRGSQRHPRAWTFASAIALALGVGAKLFPIVLAPIFVARLAGRSGVRVAGTWCLVFAAGTVVCLAPMFLHRFAAQAPRDQQAGLETFLSRWEMNDLLFMIVEENVRSDAFFAEAGPPWFTVTPASWRDGFTTTVAESTGMPASGVAFLTARVVTLAVFGVLVMIWSYRVYREGDFFLSAVFLTLAWFWLLAPTQNPWYWTWALPFVAFVRNRGWLLIAAVVMVYYCRFWFEYHPPTWTFMGQEYRGVAAFDFLVVWLEFAPALILIAMLGLVSRRAEFQSP